MLVCEFKGSLGFCDEFAAKREKHQLLSHCYAYAMNTQSFQNVYPYFCIHPYRKQPPMYQLAIPSGILEWTMRARMAWCGWLSPLERRKVL